MTTAPLTAEVVAELPKVLLHDHLDGGVRPATLVDLAAQVGHALPETDPERLAQWYADQAGAGSLEAYLATFRHPLAVLQTADALRRVAREAVEDLAADGVVYTEQRYAPELHSRGGLSPRAVVEAVAEGFADGVAAAAATGRTIHVRHVLVAMRDSDHSRETAEVAFALRPLGVVGFDLAGAEAGFPVVRHQRALRMLRQASFPVTLHAGEAAGPESIAEALHLGGALRIGHGVRIADDIRWGARTPEDPWGVEGAELGDLAHWVRDQQVPLEVCPTSNVQTGAVPDLDAHPVTALVRLGFAVTVNTDNRLVSGTSMTSELTALVEHAGWTRDDLRDVAVTAAWNAFIHHDERAGLVDDLILPAYTRSNGRHRA